MNQHSDLCSSFVVFLAGMIAATGSSLVGTAVFLLLTDPAANPVVTAHAASLGALGLMLVSAALVGLRTWRQAR